MALRKGAEIIAEHLINEKIPYIFGICGHGTVGMLDALYDVQKEIKLVSPRHEQVAAHMAANLIMATAVAQTDSSAFLAITANVPTSQFNRSPFQELNRHNQADFANVMRPVVKRSFQPTRVDMLPLALRQATTTMLSGRPGPVNLDVPFNVFQEEAEVSTEAPSGGHLARRNGASPEAVAKAVDMLLAASKPVLFIGHGVTLSEASAELTALARRFSIPVISSPNGMGCFDMEDPLSLGFIGRNGAYQANQAGRHADLVLALGARFDDRSSSSWTPGYSWNFPVTKLIHADVDHDEIGRNYPPDLGVLADAKTFLVQLLAELDRRGATEGGRMAPWLADIAGWTKAWEDFTRPNFSTHASPMRPERVVADCAAVLPDNAIISLDSGVHHNWYMQFWKARKPQSMLNTWGFSGMGFGPSGILGAKLAAPDRPCISICGDGGFTMVPHVLCTAAEYNIPVVWVVWNNFCWSAIRDIQYGLFDGREIATGFYETGNNNKPYNPDFAAWARAAGVEGVTVTKSEDFAGALEHAVASNKPYLIDVHVDAEIRPPATGTWALPPIPHKEPVFGEPYRP